MRLIDADALIKKSVVINGHRVVPYLDVIEQPTAYDVEAKVAELEKKSEEYNEKADRHIVYEDWFTRYLSIAKGIDIAIEIVRGKERKYCGNCKHQPEPLTTCEWLKSQTQIIKECPRWEGKE